MTKELTPEWDHGAYMTDRRINRIQRRYENRLRAQDQAEAGQVERAQCTLCSSEPAPGFYTGCMVNDGHAQGSGWNCDWHGNLTRFPSPRATAEQNPAISIGKRWTRLWQTVEQNPAPQEESKEHTADEPTDTAPRVTPKDQAEAGQPWQRTRREVLIEAAMKCRDIQYEHLGPLYENATQDVKSYHNGCAKGADLCETAIRQLADSSPRATAEQNLVDDLPTGDPHPCDMTEEERERFFAAGPNEVEETCLLIQRTVSDYTRRTPPHLRDCDVLTGHIVRAIKAARLLEAQQKEGE